MKQAVHVGYQEELDAAHRRNQAAISEGFCPACSQRLRPNGLCVDCLCMWRLDEQGTVYYTSRHGLQIE